MAGEMQVRGGADLAQPGLRHHVPEARHGGEQARLALPAAGLARDPLIQAVHRVIEHGDPVQVQAAQQRVMIGEPPGQRHRQVRQLPRGAHPADRQVRQHAAAALPVDQRLDHRRGGLAGYAAGNRAELDAGRLQRLGKPLDLRGAGLHRLHPVPGQVPHLPQLRRRDIRPAQQPALEQLRHPGAVPGVGLVTLQRLGVRRVDHRDLGEVLLGKRVIHRVGVDPAGLHHHVRHPAAAQLAAHRLEHPVKRPELQHLGLPCPRLLARRPDRDLNHLLVHVDPRDALIQHLHLRGHLLQRHPPRTGTRHAARQGPGQYRRLTHAHAAATGVTRHGAPAPNLLTASNGPSQTGDDERHASTTMHFPPGPAIARPHGKRPQPPATRTGRRRRGPSCRIPRQRHAVANEFLLGLPPFVAGPRRSPWVPRL